MTNHDPDSPVRLNDAHDLCFSSDDETNTGLGWHIQHYPDGLTSQSFSTSKKAIQAMNDEELKFTE